MAELSRRRVIKKIDGGHAHHGGAWKVAYADFVTAMMALFMVLWLLASTDQASRKEISNYFRTGMVPQVELSTKGGGAAISVFDAPPIPPAGHGRACSNPTWPPPRDGVCKIRWAPSPPTAAKAGPCRSR